MKNAGSVKTDAQGKFRFDNITRTVRRLPDSDAASGRDLQQDAAARKHGASVAVEVYDVAAKVPEAKVSQDMILLERTPDQLVVNETVIYTNDSKTTYQAPDGTLKIRVPADVTGPVKMRITAPQGMPISREPEKGKEPNTGS